MVAGVIVAAGILGFDAIMRLQKWLTIAMIAATLVYIALTLDHLDLGAAGGLPAGGTSAVVGASILVMTGFGVGWVNSAADYSRYLPRTASTRGVVGWPTLGGQPPGGRSWWRTACCCAPRTTSSRRPSRSTRSAR